MASKVIASNSDLSRDSPTSSINVHSDQAIRGFGSMNMDEIFRNIYPDSDNGVGEAAGGGGLDVADGAVRNGDGNKAVEEVWREMVNGGGEPAMTLEAFLAKAGAVCEEEVRIPPPVVGDLGIEGVMMGHSPGVQFAAAGNVVSVEFGSGMTAASGGGRGKRRVAVEEVPMDKATQQKQRRMIKNRESAARSRERKQAYTVELEMLVTQLEEENARLLREEARLDRERRKQLIENIIPVEEKGRAPRVLRRTRSM